MNKEAETKAPPCMCGHPWLYHGGAGHRDGSCAMSYAKDGALHRCECPSYTEPEDA